MKQNDNPLEYNRSVLGPHSFTEENDVQDYFNLLPEYIQENIMQSGVEIQSVNHLKEMVEHYTGN